jgi:hypothetical protein
MNSSSFVERLENVATATIARHVRSWRTQLAFAVTHPLTQLGRSGDLTAILRSREKLRQFFIAAWCFVLVIKAFVKAPSAVTTTKDSLGVVLDRGFALIEFFAMRAMRSPQFEDRSKQSATDEFKRPTEPSAQGRRERKADDDRPRGKEFRAHGRRRKPASRSDGVRTGMRQTQLCFLDVGAPGTN